jgi:hypothetical protein
VAGFFFLKISSFVDGIFIPALSASPLWSTTAKRATPFVSRSVLNRFTVSSTEWLLGMLTNPLAVGGFMRPPELIL